jgi:hypothetical protein
LPETSPPTLVDLLTLHTPVQDGVLSYLEIRDVIALSKTARALKDSYKVVEKTQFNIDKEMNVVFDSPDAFPSLQAEHDIPIYGPTAYSFVARHLVEPVIWNSLGLFNLVVQTGKHAVALARFLSCQGFEDDGFPLTDSIHQTLTDSAHQVSTYRVVDASAPR